MDESEILLIKKKSLSGVLALTSRTFILQAVAFFATFLLTIFLDPETFGIFYVVSAAISFLTYFSDIGLAAALIQKKEDVARSDLVTTFTIQQVLVLTLCITAFFLAPYIGSFYTLDASGVTLFKALVLAFFLSSLKTIPSILSERDLNFQKLIIPQIAETFVFYTIAVLLAWYGFGVMSFTYAVVARAVIGLVIIYAIAPWQVGIGIETNTAKRLLKFGVPFQLNSFLALLKDDLITIFLGKMLPFAQIGYIGWAKKWAEVPLRLIMDSLIRVTFPTFSRLQHNKELLGAAIEKTLFGLSITIIPISVVLLFFVEPILTLIPKYAKWEPALFSFYIFVITAIIAGFTTPLTNALNAVGQIKITMKLMVFWTIGTWILTTWFISVYGFNGFSVALFLLSLAIVYVVTVTKRFARFDFVRQVKFPLIAGFAQGLCYWGLRGQEPFSALQLTLVAAFGFIIYIAIVWRLDSKQILDVINLFRKKST